MRKSEVRRSTKETQIELALELDGCGQCDVETGVGFFDHMLAAFAMHGGFDLKGTVRGDLEVDEHHTLEDVGIVLGQAFSQALGEKRGICRFGNAYVPMDEALSFAALDISGRPYLVYEVPNDCRDLNTQLYEEFFRAFSVNAGVTLHLRALYGRNGHHMVEALFKAFARALKQGCTPSGQGCLSTKGMLE